MGKKAPSAVKSPATVKLKSRAKASSKPAQRAAPAPKREASSGGLNLRGLFSSNGTSKAKAATAPRKQISGSAVKKAPSPVKAAATAKLKSRTQASSKPAQRATPAPKREVSSGGFNLQKVLYVYFGVSTFGSRKWPPS